MDMANRSIRAIFDEAAEMAGEERQAYLDQACGEDAALRAEVEELLRSEEEAGGFLADSKRDAPSVTSQVTEQEGDRIGHYKLLQKIGEGGCGIVYMAEQTEPVRRRVALKVIKLGMDTRSVIARFEAERQAVAMMDHENIARVLDAGTTGTGRPFFVMELVRGIKITDYCEQNNLSTNARLELFIQVCQAVQHAHQKGVIHRDLKPSNILVTSDDGVPIPKVIDFGIAKATSGIQLTDKTLFTRFEMFIGTPAYMSPEQAEFNASDIDTRTDIYALGVLLYELLTGHTPFDTTALLNSGLDAMRRTIRETDPPRPSTRLTRELAGAELKCRSAEHAGESASSRRLLRLHATLKELRGDIDWIILKALEKDRTRRYETANGLAMDIQRYLASEPILARPPSAAYKFRKAFHRNRLAFLAGASVAVALIVGMTASIWQAARARQSEGLAQARLAESEAITGFLTGLFQSPDPARDGRTITVMETLAKAVKNLDRDLARAPARRARLQLTLGQTYVELGMPLEAIPLCEQARGYFLSASGPEHADALTAAHLLAKSYKNVGRDGEALKLEEMVLAGRRKVLGPEHPDTISVMELLAACYFDADREDEALQLREEALRLRLKVLGPQDAATLGVMSGVAFHYAKTGRHQEAVRLAEQAVKASREALGLDSSTTLRAMARMALVYAFAGRLEDSPRLFREVLPLMRQKMGSEHPWTLNVQMDLGRWCSDTAWAQMPTNSSAAYALAREGEQLLRKALPIFESGTNTPSYHLACVRSRYGGALSIAVLADPILAPLQSPWLTEAAFELSFPDNSATMNLLGGPSEAGTAKFAVSEWIALIKPLPVGEHLIQIKGGNTGLGHPEGTTENIWWNWVNWHITVVK